MSLCKRCGGVIPNRIVVDNKIKVISSRTYCLTCSPWGKHNTARLESVATSKTEDGQLIITCSSCDRAYAYQRKLGHSRSICNSCWNKKRKIRIKQQAVEYKGGKCCRCGYKRNIKALQFHHTEKESKDFTIGGSYTRKWSLLQAELDKCVLLCSNCHVEVHDELDQDLPYSYDGTKPL